jgi:glycosyltransferase involved in cell wall biosynthesis
MHNPSHDRPELSVVIPCLNEAETIAVVVRKAVRALTDAGIAGEVIVADNGSTDGSQALATAEGARVVPAAVRGYGAALLAGIAEARGTYVLMGDADDSYDFAELPKFLPPLRAGADLVQGCRLPSGGGTIAPGAMPFLHRWWGNPMFSMLVRWWFHAPIHDVHCGMRAFRRDLIATLGLRCTGMEFASEMIIKAALHRARIAEVPITLHRDGRVTGRPHLRTFRDGWRHLRFYLLFSPRWLFLTPGIVLGLLGLLGYALAMPQVTIGRATLDVHTLLFASLAILVGFQAVLFAVFTKAFAINQGLLPMDPRMERAFQLVDLERGLLAGTLLGLAGLALLGIAVWEWVRVDLGPLDARVTLRLVIPGVTLTALGAQTVLSSFFLSVLGLRQR